MGRGTAQPSGSATTTSAAPSPVRGTQEPAEHGAIRAGAQSSGGPNRFYVMRGHESFKASPDVVTIILTF